MEALGLPSERITISGIPIDPVFSTTIDRLAARQKYGLDPRKPTLLVSAGAFGVGPTEFIVGQLKQLRHEVQTVVVCGNSDELKTRVEKLVADDANFRVLGYSDRMFELMKMSDLLIGKPGGLTTSEALACGLPMLIVSPIPGQEERNSDHLLEEGVALKCNSLMTLPYKIDGLLDDPDRLELMRIRATRLGKPDAAQTIVDTLVNDELPPLRLDAEKREQIAQIATGEALAA
jgi:processive 1,2-diacylglycerol beta-glucosyltransferase